MNKTLIFLCLLFTNVSTKAQSVQACTDALTSGNYNMALNVCEQQLKIVAAQNQPQQVVNLYLLLIDVHHALGNSAEEDYYLAKVKNHPSYIKNQEIQYNWNRKIGQKYYLLGQYNLAKTHLDQGLTIALSENNTDWMSKSYNDMGLVENKLANYKKALSHYQKSLELKTQIGDLYKIGTTLNNLGLVHKNLEEYQQSTNYYEQALDTFIQYTQTEGFDKRVSSNISHLYEDLSAIYIQANQIDKASLYANEIVNTFELKFSPHEQTRALINLAKLQIVKEEYQQAQITINKAQKHNDFSIEILYQLSSINVKLDNLSIAISFAEEGLELALQKQHSLIMDFHQLLSQLYLNFNQNKAIEHLLKYQEYREKFLNKKYNSELKTIQHKIETQQIQHELISEQLKNSQSESKIRKLTNWILLASLLLVFSFAYMLLYRFKKKKQHESLIQSINYHKQQLLLISSDEERDLPPPREDIKKAFNQQLVKTFVEAINIWEKHTHTNRVEFADQSKLWTVSIDNGTLRTRSLDKYLKLEKLPKNPRWRSVVKSCHFILSDPTLTSGDRESLSHQLDQLMTLYKKLSLVK